jgi:hypothetical protein
MRLALELWNTPVIMPRQLRVNPAIAPSGPTISADGVKTGDVAREVLGILSLLTRLSIVDRLEYLSRGRRPAHGN